jgi:hypothetical protein
MKLSSFEAIIQALNSAKVRYLIAGGIAVNAYGYLRFTKDIDIVIELVPENIKEAFAILDRLGYRPNVAITTEQFCDAGNRRRWAADKQMQVLQFWSEQHRETPVDIFIEVPFDFRTEYAAATSKELRGVGAVPIVSLAALVQMKKAANREQDRTDLENLRLLYPQEIPP